MNQIQLDHKAMLKDHKIEIARLEAILVEKGEKIAELSKANKILLSRVCAAVADIKQLKAVLEDIHQECFMQSIINMVNVNAKRKSAEATRLKARVSALLLQEEKQ